MADGRVTTVRGRSGGVFGKVMRVRGMNGGFGQSQVTRVRGRATGPTPAVTAGSNMLNLEPFTVATLAAAGPNEDDVITWAWTQTGGPDVDLVGTGATMQYVTPGTRAGVSLTFQATGTFADATTSTASVAHTIRAHGGPWMYSGGVLVAVGINPPTLTAPAPLAASARQYLIGVSRETPSGTATETWVQAFETQMGAVTDMSHYYHTWDNSSFPTTDEKARASAGGYPLIAWQTGRLNGTTPTWAGIAAGSEDTQIDAVAARFKAAPGRYTLNYENEPELDTVWQRHGSSATVYATSLAEYKAAFKRIVTRFRAAGVTNVDFAFVSMGVATTNRKAQVLAAYPGDAYVDVVGFDPYNRNTGGVWSTFDDIVEPWYTWAQTNVTADRPYILAEYGCVEDATLPNRRADWFTAMGDSIMAGTYPNLRGFAYFDHTDVTATGEYALGSGPAFNAYKAMTERIKTVPLTGALNILRQRVPSGYYAHIGSSGTGTSATLGSGTLRLQPWLVTDTITIDRIGCEVTVVGTAGSLVRLVIYGDNGSGYPGDLVLDAGTVAGDAVATAELTVSQALTAGNIYWIGGVLQGTLTTQPTVRTANPPMGVFAFNVGTTSKPGTNETVAGYTMAGVTGAAPSTFSTTKALAGSVPRIFVRSA